MYASSTRYYYYCCSFAMIDISESVSVGFIHLSVNVQKKTHCLPFQSSILLFETQIERKSPHT